MKLTKRQIAGARRVVAWLRITPRHARGAHLDDVYPGHERLPGYQAWLKSAVTLKEDARWADALEAAITEAEGTQAPQLGPVSDADERAFWREVFTSVHDDDERSVATAADQADEALKRYRKAFCTGMPSDQKGSE